MMLQYVSLHQDGSMYAPLYQIRTRTRVDGRVSIEVEYSRTLSYLPVLDRERALEAAALEAHKRVVEAFEECAA